MAQRIGILFVDDELRLRRAWEKFVRTQDDLEFLGALDCADTLADEVERTDADVVLMDVSMPGQDPLIAVEALAGTRPACRVVLYSGLSDPELVRRAIDAGAWGFVDKVEDPSRVLAVIRAVAAGQVALPQGYSR